MELPKKVLLLKGVGKVLAVIGTVFLVLSMVFLALGEDYDLPEVGELMVDMFLPSIVCFITGCGLYLTGYFTKILKG